MQLGSPIRKRRGGVSMVEAGLILPVFLTIILGMIDVSMGMFNAHALSEVARQTARRAIVHGALAPSALGTWGPSTYTATANDSSAIAQEVQTFLCGLDPNAVTIKVEWLDGGNAEDQRVRVTLTTTYQPMTTYVLGGAMTLGAVSTMRIAH